MAAPTFVGKVDTGADSSSINVAAPSGAQAGDHQLVFIGVPSTSITVTSVPSGWTLERTQQGNDTGTNFTLRCYRSSTAGSSSATFGLSGSTTITAVRVAYRGGSGVESSVSSADASSTSNHALATATTTVADSVVVAAGYEDSSGTPKTHSMTGWTERSDYDTSGLSRVGMLAVYDIVKSTPGTQGGTIVSSSGDYMATISVVLAGGSAFDPPGSVFDLASWKITLPTEDPEDPGDADEVRQPELDTYADQHFYLDGSDRMVMVAPTSGPNIETTGGSSATRCELREMEDGDEAAWTMFDAEPRSLTVTGTFDPTGISGGSQPRPEMIIGQIHSDLGNPALYIAAEYHVATPRLRLFKYNGSSTPGVDNMLAGSLAGDGSTVVSYRIEYDPGNNPAGGTGRVKVYAAVGTADNLDLDNPDFTFAPGDFFDQTEGLYFKAGAYNKTTVASGSTGAAVATISHLELTRGVQPEGQSVRFDGDGEEYTRTLSPALGPALTVLGWFRIAVDRNDWTTVFGLDQNAGSGTRWALQTNQTGTTLRYYVDGSGENAQEINGGELTVGTWYCVAIVKTGASAGTIYLGDDPGSLATTTMSTGHASYTTFRIGDSGWGGEWLNGNVAAVKVYSAALSAQDVADELAQYAPRRTADLYAAYLFFDGPSTTDESGNGRTLSGGSGTTAEAGPSIPWSLSVDYELDGDAAALAAGTGTVAFDEHAEHELDGAVGALAAGSGAVVLDEPAVYDLTGVAAALAAGGGAGDVQLPAEHELDGAGAALAASAGALTFDPHAEHQLDGAGAALAAAGGVLQFDEHTEHDRSGAAAALAGVRGTRTVQTAGAYERDGQAAALAAGTGAGELDEHEVSDRAGAAAALAGAAGAVELDTVNIFTRAGSGAALVAATGEGDQVSDRTGAAAALAAGSGAVNVSHAATHERVGASAALVAGNGLGNRSSAAEIETAGSAAALAHGSGTVTVTGPTTYELAGGAAAVPVGRGHKERVRSYGGSAAAVPAGTGAGALVPPAVHVRGGDGVALAVGSGLGEHVEVTVYEPVGSAGALAAAAGTVELVEAGRIERAGTAAALGAAAGVLELDEHDLLDRTGAGVALAAGRGLWRIGGVIRIGTPYRVGTHRAGQPVAAGTQRAGEPVAVGAHHAGEVYVDGQL